MALDSKGKIAPDVTITLGSDGWYYTNVGYRFHGSKYPKPKDNCFSEVWDLEIVK